MKQDIKQTTSWSEVYEHDGFKLTVSTSNHPLVYLDIPEVDHNNDGKPDTNGLGKARQECAVLSVEQLYQLRNFVDHAIRDLETNKRWPKKPMTRSR